MYSALKASALLIPTMAQAQETSQPFQDFLTGVVGQEVALDGHIGSGMNMMDDEALAFRTLDGTYFPIVFDAGRNARRQVDGCQFQMFGGGTPCRMTGQAELEWDGAQLRLIIFEVAKIEPPTRLD